MTNQTEAPHEPNPTVLLVEDSEMQQKLFSSLLRRNGFEVVCAETGAIALARLREFTPRAIVLDYILPDTNGHELCVTIRRFPEWGDLPIVMLTSHNEIDRKVLAFDGGIDDYVDKTVDPTELVARLQRVLRRHEEHRELTEKEKLQTLHRSACTLAHGINNPLAVISMGIEMLSEEFPTESPHRTLLDKMGNHLTRIKQLVSRLQSMTRLVEQPDLADFDILDVPSGDLTEPPPRRRRRGSYRVLIADDDLDIRDLTRLSLEKTGRFSITECGNGLDALQMALKDPPDVFILDIMMPGLDGYSLCQRIKSHPILREIPVIMLSVRANVRDMVRAFELGAANYLVKPFDSVRLPEQIFRTLERQGVPALATGPSRER